MTIVNLVTQKNMESVTVGSRDGLVVINLPGIAEVYFTLAAVTILSEKIDKVITEERGS